MQVTNAQPGKAAATPPPEGKPTTITITRDPGTLEAVAASKINLQAKALTTSLRAQQAASERHAHYMQWVRGQRLAHMQAATVQPSQTVATNAYVGGGAGGAGGALGRCIRNAEEGGRYVWGPGNGGGAYQFARDTWWAYNGHSYAGYDSAGPAWQDRVFEAVVAAGAQAVYNAWESDGCPQKFGMY